MILRGLLLEHWCCIARLELADLPLGVLVLHAPNRTGKSSLVKALRSCLYDHDHDTTRQEVLQAIPWTGKHAPRVTVTFETGGQVYRITKVYSRKKDGGALLERRSGERWLEHLREPKEAARETRKLLGADKSDASLNQLLWLDQGQVHLPQVRKLDATLEKRLEEVLGTLVTGRDLEFKKALDKRCDRWFTPRRHDHRGGVNPSPVTRLEQKRAERQRDKEALEKQYRDLEQAINDLERCDIQQGEMRKHVREARDELTLLLKEREHSQARRQEHLQARRDEEAAQQETKNAQARWQQRIEARERYQAHETDLTRREAEVKTAQEKLERFEEVYQQQVAALGTARLAEETHARTWDDIEDRRKLLELTTRSDALQKTLQRITRLEQESKRLNEQMQSYPAPDKVELEKLRANRRQAQALRAQLQAAELVLGITPSQATRLRLSRDGQAAEEVDLSPGEKKTWPLRQRVSLEVAGLGRIDLARRQENTDLERCARQLADLDRVFAERIQAYQETPQEESCLDRLAERLFQQEAWLRELEQLRRQLGELAPQGTGAKQHERLQLERERRLILQRRPELASWPPSPGDCEQRVSAFQLRARELERQRKTWEAQENQAHKALQQAQRECQRCQENLTDCRATARAAQQELQRLGGEEALKGELLRAEAALKCARQRLAETELTEAEKSVEERCRSAETVLEQREDRLRRLEQQMAELRGRLHGSEGLHQKRNEAASALTEVEQALEQERLEAEAHKHLRELFENYRESQVHRVMGPISGRVLQWARHLGLSEYEQVCFSDGFLPDGLLRCDGTAETPLVPLSEESYGTEEQLGLLVRLALGGVLARTEPALAILDDPLAHADPAKHRRILEILKMAAEGNQSAEAPAGPLQILILTCHPDRFDHLTGARHINLAELIQREP
jgi:DNA repair exonuclease SbcCD ATPase subunit